MDMTRFFLRVKTLFIMYHYSYKIVLHNYERKDGKRLIYLHANINSKRVRINLKVAVKEKYFDSSKQIIKKSAFDADYLNAIIDDYKSRASEIFKQFRLNNKVLNSSKFLYLLENEAMKKDFIIFLLDKIREIEKNKEVEKSTLKGYMKAYNMLLKYTDSVLIVEIDTDWCKSFELFLKNRNLAHNTIVSYHKKLSKFFDLAINDLDLNVSNPFKTFKSNYIDGNKEFLELFEVEKLVKLYYQDIPSHWKDTLRMFLFMVGTGLRISDASKLNRLHIKNNCIDIRVQKTKRFKMNERFPLSEFAKQFIVFDKNGNLFKYNNSQSINKNLVIIFNYLEIDKKITSHCARHTFATTFLLCGGRVEVLQRLLGHTRIDATMIYVHITKKMERKELAIMDKFLIF